jgi:hypothetical protein
MTSCVYGSARAYGRPHLDRRGAAQAEGDRGARERDLEARRGLCSRTAPGTRRASDRKAAGEDCDAHERRDDEPAMVCAHRPSARVDPVPGDADGAHEDGHTIGLIPAGLRHVSTRAGSLR